MYLADIYTVTADLAGIPGISMPCGETKEKLPIGLHPLGRHFDEMLSGWLRLGEAQAYTGAVPAEITRRLLAEHGPELTVSQQQQQQASQHGEVRC